jgi:CRISPR/Cas system-associated exonuclease Cas4 (RecB family)
MQNSSPVAGPDSAHGGAVESQPAARPKFELRHVSHSAANQYLMCGEKYRLERVEGNRGAPHLAAIAGSAFHAWTEAYDKGETDTATTFVGFLEDGLERLRVSDGLNVTDLPHSKGEPLDRWLTLGPTLCEKYVAWTNSRETDDFHWEVDQIELEYLHDLGLAIPAKGFIDREFLVTIRGHTYRVLVDIKTNAKMPQTPQLMEYATIRRMQGVRIDYVAYYDARHGKLTPLIDPSPWTEQWLKEYYGYVVDNIQAGVFQAKPGVPCRWCSVRDLCVYKEIK